MKLHNRVALLFAVAFAFATAIQAQDISTLMVTENGVGPINKTTPFDLKKIQLLLPTLQVKKAIEDREGDGEFPVLRVMDQNQLLLVIYPVLENKRKIDYISIRTSRIQTSTGIKIGALFPQIYPTGRPKGCAVLLEEMTGRIQCTAPNSKHIEYVFTGKGFPEGDAAVPQLKILRRGKIQSILWAP